MRTLNNVIVEADNEYNNTYEMASGHSLIINISVDSVSNINRIAKVKASPEGTILEEGDLVIVHHNILRIKNSVRGEYEKSDFYIKDNLYYVPLDQVYMYKRGDADWQSLDPYCFVKPIQITEKKQNGLFLTTNTDTLGYKGNVENRGIMKYCNKELESYGVKVGDEIVFSRDSEYEFEIDGEIYYRIKSNNILATVE